ncbi:MAG TPA: 30S ribosomal protein S6, partial [Ktedonobacterales bacterium]|nr:30S ribosomal protein S6 [Ktedonobacterales bacterium]
GIQRYREGYYAFMEFRLDSLALRDLDRVMRVQENVMRHLITWRDPRAQAERRLREQRAAAVAAAQAAAQAAQAAQVTQTVPPVEAPASEEPDSSAATETAPDAAEPATAE